MSYTTKYFVRETLTDSLVTDDSVKSGAKSQKLTEFKDYQTLGTVNLELVGARSC